MRLDKNRLCFTFGIDDINVIEDDDRFAITKIRAFAEKENAHTKPISLKSLKTTANTIYNIPIVVEFNDWNDDGIGTHSKAEIPVGFVYSENNPVTFEYDEERDKNFLTIKALIWKNYSKNIVDIIHKSNDKKKVSVEMTTTDYEQDSPFDKPEVFSWKYQAITILSDQVAEACKGSKVQLLKFSEDKENYIKENFVEDYKQDEGENVEDEKKVTEAEATEPEKKEEAKVEEAEATKTEEKTEEKVEEAEETKAETEEKSTKTVEECADTKMGCGDEKMAEATEDKEEKTEETSEESKEEETTEEDKKEEKVEESEEPEEKKEEMSLTEAMAEISNLTAENEQLKKDNEAYMAKFEAMSDYEELKAFKFAAEEKEKQEADMLKMCEVLDEISEKGVEMSEDERNAYIAKFSEYDSVAAWSNMVKAAEFDRVGAPSGNIHKIGLPYGSKKKTSGSIWAD